jgi:hypothetical protein
MFHDDGPLLAAGRGALAGAIATLAMSVLMLAARALRLTPQLPPARITREATEAVAGEAPADEEEAALTSAVHVGFGAAAGALFGVLHRSLGRSGTWSAAALGVAYASIVYLVSYQGWVPALRILPPASRDDPGRVSTMVAAHWVYGATLGAVAELLRRR